MFLAVLLLQMLEHPQNVLLSKVVDSNFSLCNAKASQQDILQKWRILQNSVNLLFDSTKGFGTYCMNYCICCACFSFFINNALICLFSFFQKFYSYKIDKANLSGCCFVCCQSQTQIQLENITSLVELVFKQMDCNLCSDINCIQ